MAMSEDEMQSFKGYRLNIRGVILGKLNPMLFPPLFGIFFFSWPPARYAFLIFMAVIFVLDFADVRPSEAIRGLVFKFIKRVRVVSCSTTKEAQLRNLKRMKLL